MIASFRHGGLKAPYEGKTARRAAPAHVAKPRDILAALDLSQGPEGMILPGFRLHEESTAKCGADAESGP